MTESTSFFSDPKVLISLLALFIAIISFIWSLSNQWEQNKRWDKLNEGKPEIVDIKFVYWKEWTKEEALNLNWGYNPHLYGKEEASEIVVAPYKLVLRDMNNKLISKINPVFTITEAQNELERIKYKGNSTITKLFRPIFKIDNIGKTEITDLFIIVDAKMPGKEWERAFTSNPKINLNGGQKTSAYFEMELPINFLPDYIQFKVTFNYKDYKGNSIESIIGVKWTSDKNHWSYENIDS